MAKHLARIHGTEEDKVNCPFYFKIGTCRHAERCSRLHHKPAFSPTILIQHVYKHPLASTTNEHFVAPAHLQNNPELQMEDFLCFFEEFYLELSKFGKIESLNVVDNLGDHMVGHVYVKYYDEEDAADALGVLNGRYYDGRRLVVEYSPVTDFREARCRDYDEDICSRGGYCNFLHVKPIPGPLLRSLEDEAEIDRRQHSNYHGTNNKHRCKIINDKDKRNSSKKKRKHTDKGGSTGTSPNNTSSTDKQQSKRSKDRRSRSNSDGSDDNSRTDEAPVVDGSNAAGTSSSSEIKVKNEA